MAYKVSVGFYRDTTKTPEQIGDKDLTVTELGIDPTIKVKHRHSGKEEEIPAAQLEPSIHNFFLDGKLVRPLSRVAKYFDESVPQKVSEPEPVAVKETKKAKKKKV